MKNTGGPAFPALKDTTKVLYQSDNKEDEIVYEHSFVGGMTLRDWFAGQALSGAASLFQRKPTPEEIKAVAEQLYLLADAMLAERDK